MQYKLPDFDTLQRMAEDNPKELEILRKQLSQQVIDAAPDRIKKRLHGLQFQIDAQCAMSHNPLAACIKLSAMMHESLASLRDLLNEVAGQNMMQPQLAESEITQSAQVIPFRPR